MKVVDVYKICGLVREKLLGLGYEVSVRYGGSYVDGEKLIVKGVCKFGGLKEFECIVNVVVDKDGNVDLRDIVYGGVSYSLDEMGVESLLKKVGSVKGFEKEEEDEDSLLDEALYDYYKFLVYSRRPRRWVGEREIISSGHKLIDLAIKHRRRMRIYYVAKDGKVSWDRVIEPHYVYKAKTGNKILVAWDTRKMAWRSFIIKNIVDYEVKKERTYYDRRALLNLLRRYGEKKVFKRDREWMFEPKGPIASVASVRRGGVEERYYVLGKKGGVVVLVGIFDSLDAVEKFLSGVDMSLWDVSVLRGDEVVDYLERLDYSKDVKKFLSVLSKGDRVIVNGVVLEGRDGLYKVWELSWRGYPVVWKVGDLEEVVKSVLEGDEGFLEDLVFFRRNAGLGVIDVHIERPFTVAVDFDGVIVNKGVWEGELDKVKFGELVPGVKEALRELKSWGVKIIIYTCRTDIEDVKKFLDLHGIVYDEVNYNFDFPWSPKVLADVYIDDRAFRFEGDWKAVLDFIFSGAYLPWWKKREGIYRRYSGGVGLKGGYKEGGI